MKNSKKDKISIKYSTKLMMQSMLIKLSFLIAFIVKLSKPKKSKYPLLKLFTTTPEAKIYKSSLQWTLSSTIMKELKIATYWPYMRKINIC